LNDHIQGIEDHRLYTVTFRREGSVQNFDESVRTIFGERLRRGRTSVADESGYRSSGSLDQV